MALREALVVRPRRALRRLSLRARLLLGLLLVAALGLIVADVVVYNEISSYLNTQVNNELQSGVSSLVQNNRLQSHPLPVGIGAEVLYFNGSVPYRNPGNFSLQLSSGELSSLAAAAQAGDSAPFASTFQVQGGSNSAGDYLVQAELIPNLVSFNETGPAIAFIAIPLGSLNGTLHQLVLIDLIASAAVLLLLGLLGYAVVRVGLRPLERIQDTAGAIAAGDLAERVELDNPHTEVGRLGASLNEMLGQIEHAFDEQRASEERLRQFLADASHELRTPVTSIRGYAELFRRGMAERPVDLASAMQRIEDESQRMGMLVEDLLLLARLDQGRPLERRPVDLAALVADVAADAQVLASDRVVSVELPEQLIVDADEARIHQIVANLMQNALRYSAAGSPIELRLRAEREEAVLSVTDHGIGIAPEHLGHVFERFYRADPSRTRNLGGTGLGLAIVLSIVEAHGGAVGVSSALGEGSTFTVRLPIRAEVTAAVSEELGADPEDLAGVPTSPVVLPGTEPPSAPPDQEASSSSPGFPGPA